MSNDKQLTIIDITRENVHTFWTTISNAIRECSFIAIDCELSGLGNRKHHKEGDVDDRYKLLCAIAKSHSVIAFGLSCFTCTSTSKIDTENSSCIKSQNYVVQTFNILTLCVDNYEIEYGAMTFLLSHGFDFNRQYKDGLLYYRGDDVTKHREPAVLDDHSVRNIFQSIVKHEKPIVLHNGFMDLLFMYQNFYADLPENNETFSADLASMFPNGIYDTKYIADKNHLPASYLPYIFNKLLLTNRNRQQKGQWHVNVNFPPYPTNLKGLLYFPYKQVLQYHPMLSMNDLCEGYKFHGWCPKADKCEMSHNIYEISHLSSYCEGKTTFNPSLYPTCEIIARMKSNIKKSNLMDKSPNKRLYSLDPCIDKDVFAVESFTEIKTENKTTMQACHSAGYDAFMTGFAFASYVTIFGTLSSTKEQFTPHNIDMDMLINRIFFVGKSYPFVIDKSYSPLSKKHCCKVKRMSQ